MKGDRKNRRRQIKESAVDNTESQFINIEDDEEEIEEPESSSMRNGVYIEFNDDEATELLFDFEENTLIGVLGRFLVWGLVTDDLQYDAVKLEIDGEEYGITTMPDVSKSEYIHSLFIEVVNDYVRDCESKYDCWSGWEIFDHVKNGLTVNEGMFTTKIPQYDEWEEEFVQYELELQTREEKFYVFGNKNIVLNYENEIVTEEDLESYDIPYLMYVTGQVVNNKIDALYTSENWEYNVESMLEENPEFFDDEE